MGLFGRVDGLVLMAQAAEAAASEEGNAVLKFLNDGGEMMWVILVVSLIGTALFLLKAQNLYLARRLNATAFVAKVVEQRLAADRIADDGVVRAPLDAGDVAPEVTGEIVDAYVV